ncbi:MAG: hypothetical protein WC100_12075 [Sterolibacterium sp.]
MSDYPKAKLAYLTEPTPGQAVINVQIESGDLVRVIINHDQLKKIIYDGARIEYGYVEGRV